MKTTRLLWLLLCFVSTNTLAQSGELQLTLSPLKQSYQEQDSLTIEFSLRNTSSNSLRVLKRGTPFEGSFSTDMFEVMFGKVLVPYIGRRVKRRPPGEADYLRLLPGERVSTRFDLSRGYEMDRAGLYTVRYRDNILKAFRVTGAVKTRLVIQVQSSSITLQLIEDRPPLSSLEISTGNFVACSVPQQSTLNDSLTSAQTIALQSQQILNSTPTAVRPGAQRYITWFGQYQSSRYSTVTSNFQNISAALVDPELSFDCSCNEDIYAYVVSFAPKKVFLCNIFWQAPLVGTDSRAGTLIHEVSHFFAVANTADYVYGQTDCKALAISDPDSAIDNADSHEYFAENTPFLSMSSGSVPSGAGATINPAPWLLLLLE